MAYTTLKWENVESDKDDRHKYCTIKRAKVPGGLAYPINIIYTVRRF
jgi:hypothetical protein